METRIGFGYDSHAFASGVPLRIGGLTLDHPEGLAGHSDGDVLLHAITDALLGAIAAGDIGSFFRRAIRSGRTPTRRSFSTWHWRRCNGQATAS
jgi:2-C-methyl-D-erythritol 2,4-cyclodiphosphate synthase